MGGRKNGNAILQIHGSHSCAIVIRRVGLKENGVPTRGYKSQAKVPSDCKTFREVRKQAEMANSEVRNTMCSDRTHTWKNMTLRIISRLNHPLAQSHSASTHSMTLRPSPVEIQYVLIILVTHPLGIRRIVYSEWLWKDGPSKVWERR